VRENKLEATLKKNMKTIITIGLILISSLVYSQYETIGEYSFSSTGYYFGKPEHMKNDAVTESYSEIHIVGKSSDYKSIKKFTEFDPYSYGFDSASTDGDGKGIWICSDAEYNKGLQKVIYDPTTMILEFKFKNGISQIFFNVKRVK
jgi:hypothetical protein